MDILRKMERFAVMENVEKGGNSFAEQKEEKTTPVSTSLEQDKNKEDIIQRDYSFSSEYAVVDENKKTGIEETLGMSKIEIDKLKTEYKKDRMKSLTGGIKDYYIGENSKINITIGDITKIQGALKGKGITIKIDNKFGNSMYLAILEFQNKNGLVADGKLKTDSLKKLGLIKDNQTEADFYQNFGKKKEGVKVEPKLESIKKSKSKSKSKVEIKEEDILRKGGIKITDPLYNKEIKFKTEVKKSTHKHEEVKTEVKKTTYKYEEKPNIENKKEEDYSLLDANNESKYGEGKKIDPATSEENWNAIVNQKTTDYIDYPDVEKKETQPEIQPEIQPRQVIDPDNYYIHDGSGNTFNNNSTSINSTSINSTDGISFG